MKYKVGDTVLIKSWKELKKTHGLNEDGNIKTEIPFFPSREEELKLNNRIIKIKRVEEDRDTYLNYGRGYSGWGWSEDMIEGVPVPINHRSEILDLEEE